VRADLFCSASKCSHLRQEPEAPYNNETSRGLHRINPPAEAGGFQAAGLISDKYKVIESVVERGKLINII
jgi:hypothetical protein